MHTGTTLTQFIIEEQRRTAGATGDFTSLLNDVVTACKAISNVVNKGALLGVMGSLDSENVQGETQKKLDVITNDIMIRSNEWAGHLAGMASEEMDDPYPIPAQYPLGKYLLVFDPLDGSSNVDVNISVGTIFSILEAPIAGRPAKSDDFLQPGTQQVCAGYAIYGSSTMLVLTFGDGDQRLHAGSRRRQFRADPRNMTIPSDTREFAINASNQRFWEAPVKRYVGRAVWPARPARADATSTCAGSPRWWRKCIASSPAAACSCTRKTPTIPPRPASCA